MKKKNHRTTKKFRVGLALSGGGIKGLAHAGVLKALGEFNIIPEIIAGVSSGAVIGALHGTGYSPDEIVALFDDFSFRKMTRIRIPEGGFFRVEPFEDFLKQKLKSNTFEALSVPLRVVATDLDKGKAVVFSKGDLIPAVIASCSIPVLFTPKKIDGVHYVDGGVVQNFPVSVIREECERIIGVNASPMVADNYKLSLLNVASRSYHFMFKANIIHDKEICDHVIEPPDLGYYGTFDVEKSHEIYELGYKTAKKYLNEIDSEELKFLSV